MPFDQDISLSIFVRSAPSGAVMDALQNVEINKVKKLLLPVLLALFMGANAYAHTAFTLVSSEKKTVNAADVAAFERSQTAGKKEGSNLTFTEKEIRLVIFTGPEDDMLSYRVQGVRNPTLIIPAGASMKILFINVDTDMRHDVRFGHVDQPFGIAVDIAETAGSTKLAARAEDGTLQAEEIVVKANGTGQYVYLCSVRGHAKGGMWGNIAVGVKPGPNVKPPEKIEHVHSADEEKDHGDPAAAQPAASPTPHDHAPAKPSPSPTPHDHGAMPAASPTPAVHDHAAAADPKAAEHTGHSMEMRSVTNIGDPMSRESSGTAWVPDSSPMYAWSKMYEDGGMLMLMGSGFLRYTQIGSSRDVSVGGKGSRSRFDAPTMFMAMYSRPLTERSQFGFRAMVSLDPIIQRGHGYPLLYQSGELYRGEPIHDRQHPHDFVSELAVTYSYKVNDKQSFFLYAGYPGEPALGPPTFMHRVSAMNNPDAPISHHWQDATHITWGVITAGYSFGKFKIEASAFKGREPDENRWAFDPPKLDSFSGRFSWNPTDEWAFQISHGQLKNPEPSEPDVRILRKTTASAIYNKKIDENRNWANSFVWGQNHANGERTNSFLFESNYDWGKNGVFGRLERVQKSGHELVLDHDLEHDIFWVGAYSLGYVRDIVRDKGIDVGLGGMLTANNNPAALTPYYGGNTHGGWQVFMRFRPSKMSH
jgi:hypothetical protein